MNTFHFLGSSEKFVLRGCQKRGACR
ncbi:hypothetical protein, partial [Zavarzinella formosa]